MRVFHQKSAAAGKQYYAASDYYENGPEQLKGLWIGTGAKLLGLDGEIDKEHFDRIVDNLHPFEDKKLTPRNHANRRILTDVTFSAPKSVSILFGVTEDYAIADAVRESAIETFADLEKDAQTRVNHKRGILTYEPTENIVGGLWLHLTGRPEPDDVYGSHPDMQLHVHGAILNATFDSQRDRWTAVDLSNAVRDSGYYDSLFMSRLATKMKALGYAVERSEHNFEVAGISRDTIEKFSRRTEKINQMVAEGKAERLAAKEGITLKDAKDRIGAMTRNAKSSEYSVADLPEIWRERLDESETRQIDRVLRGAVESPQKQISAEQAVELSKAHNFERESVVRQRQILKDALRYGVGEVEADQIHKEVDRQKWIREGEGSNALLSTQEILQEEQNLMAFARQGRGKLRPLAPDHVIERDWLSDEQKEAVDGLLKSKDRVQILTGRAGVGKTTLMSEAISAIERGGKDVTVLAPTAEAAHDVLAKEGFSAETLATFLVNKEVQEQSRNGVIWVDEAGLAGMQDVAKLADIAKRMDARIVLSGDDRQHKSVSRGKPLALLESEAGLVPKTVSKIRRQQSTDYRQAVEALSQGDIAGGFEQLESLGAVHQVADAERYKQLAKDYADSIEKGKSTLVIAPTHAERAIVNDAIRSEMKARGHIHHDEHSIGMLKSKRLTEAQRTDSFNFQKDDVVEFVTRGKGGFKAGDRLKITKVDGAKVFAESDKGPIEVPLDSPRSFDVYRWHDAKFAAGDQIRITKKDKSNKLYNGTMVSINGFDDHGRILLSNGKKISSEWGHIDYGTSITSHSSQGKTYDRVLVAQSSTSFPASSPEQIYVTASRGREQIDIYTDDAEGLRQAIERHRPQMSATALDAKANSNRSMVRRAVELRLRAQHVIKRQLQRIQDWIKNEPEQARGI
jgi:conjugative relaxase-like TrwC/TraI family protein